MRTWTSRSGLASRADELERTGRLQAADEYARLWDAAVSALEQCAAILGNMELDAAGFSRLYLLTLSQYAVGRHPRVAGHGHGGRL